MICCVACHAILYVAQFMHHSCKRLNRGGSPRSRLASADSPAAQAR